MANRVLVVDDSKNNLTLEKDLLEIAGFTVFEAENCLDGIVIAKRELPDVIVMDVRLPDMRGSEAAKLLRADPATQGIPIVFVTASVLPLGKAELHGIPNSGFIGKPINTRTFAKEIHAFVGAVDSGAAAASHGTPGVETDPETGLSIETQPLPRP